MRTRGWALTLLASLAVHSSLWFAYEEHQKQNQVERRTVPVFVSSILSTSELDKLIRENRNTVNSDAPETPLTAKQKEARFASEKNRRVEKETFARGTGRPAAISDDGGGGGADAASETLRRLGMKTVLKDRAAESTGTGIVATPGSPGDSIDLLPSDVVQGAQTMLNTDEYRFSSFYNRAKAEIQPRWAPRVDRINRVMWRTLPEGVYVTDLAIGTSSDGVITWVEVTKKSGFADFDQAALDSIWDLKRFNNLPRELINRQGRYQTTFSFVVQLSKKGMRFDTMSENDQKRWPQDVPKSR